MLAKIKQVLACKTEFLLDFLFPPVCVVCLCEGTFLCVGCFNKIILQKNQVCPICYRISQAGLVCSECRAKNPLCFLDGLMVAGVFKEKSVLQKSIHQFKYEFIKDLNDPLAKLFIPVLQKNISSLWQDYVFCPVPLHKKRLAWRGFNQASLLTDQIVKKNNLNRTDFLLRTTFNRPQMELTKEARLKNVENAFELAQNLNPGDKKIILIDDVATTTATLNACAKVLKKAGAREVHGLVLARVY